MIDVGLLNIDIHNNDLKNGKPLMFLFGFKNGRKLKIKSIYTALTCGFMFISQYFLEKII